MILILAIIIIFSESQVVYADGFGNDLSEAGSIIQRLALCGGALGVAFSGIELAYGNEQDFSDSGGDSSGLSSSVCYSHGTESCLRFGMVSGALGHWLSKEEIVAHVNINNSVLVYGIWRHS